MTAPPDGLRIATQAAPLDASMLAVLELLMPAGPDGVHLTGELAAAGDALVGLMLARPERRPDGRTLHVLTTSWHRTEAMAMLMAAPDALDNWTPPWWPRGDLDRLADDLAPNVGIELARWCAASVAGLELAR